MDFLKSQLIKYAKEQLINELQKQIQNGEKGIDIAFENLKKTLNSYTVLNTIRDGICSSTNSDDVKTELKNKIDEIDFSAELKKMKENMPEITEDMKNTIDALPVILKNKLKDLIDDLIDCNAASTSSESGVPATSGGKRARNTKRKHRKKTKKHYKKSRGRK
jgi:hypothetical protein